MRAHVFMLAAALAVASCGEVPAVPDAGAACTTAADCTDVAAPFCVNSKCVAACSVHTDCTDAAHPICASDGACVGCTSNGDCGGDAPICDNEARECRGCSKDTECTGGVCIEAEGTCVADADVAYVTMMGTDAGTCTRVAPCATIAYAIGQAGSRRVIHVLGGSLQTAAIDLTGNRVLDGEDTALVHTAGTPITITAPATVVVGGFRVAAPSNMLPAINVTGSGAKATLHGLTITGPGGPIITGAFGTEVTIRRSHIGSLTSGSSNQVSCQNGKLRVDQNTFENAYVAPVSGTCETIVTRNRFESGFDRSVGQTGGHLTMENNLIIHRDGYNDSIFASSLGAGSVIRFNTVVNTTALPSDGAALSCDSSVNATSNIFAYNSGHPITGQGCAPRYSIFDDESTTSAGTGNQVVGIETIFVNRAVGDYHLAPSSAARGGAEPGQTMVKIDYDGADRPAPAGSIADCGAFEAQD
jgi:hypothetical protein